MLPSPESEGVSLTAATIQAVLDDVPYEAGNEVDVVNVTRYPAD